GRRVGPAQLAHQRVDHVARALPHVALPREHVRERGGAAHHLHDRAHRRREDADRDQELDQGPSARAARSAEVGPEAAHGFRTIACSTTWVAPLPTTTLTGSRPGAAAFAALRSHWPSRFESMKQVEAALSSGTRAVRSADGNETVTFSPETVKVAC